MIKKGVNDKINEIEVRCKGITKDKDGKEKPCNRMFFIGTPGFDIYGKPKEIIVKCQKCGNYNIITCRIREEIIVRLKE